MLTYSSKRRRKEQNAAAANYSFRGVKDMLHVVNIQIVFFERKLHIPPTDDF